MTVQENKKGGDMKKQKPKEQNIETEMNKQIRTHIYIGTYIPKYILSDKKEEKVLKNKMTTQENKKQKIKKYKEKKTKLKSTNTYAHIHRYINTHTNSILPLLLKNFKSFIIVQ